MTDPLKPRLRERVAWTEEDSAIIARQLHRVIFWQCEPAFHDMLVFGTGITRVDEASVSVVARAWADYMEPAALRTALAGGGE